MKVVSSQQMADIEAKALQEGASEEEFMEEAGSGIALIAHEFAEKNNIYRKVSLLCGKGKNSGDAYVAGINLLYLDYDVTAYQLFPLNACSKSCQENCTRFLNSGGKVIETPSLNDIDLSTGFIIDGLFGTGFKGQVSSEIEPFILLANASHLPIISADIPSGLDGNTGEVTNAAIEASITAYVGLPKRGFFLRDGWNHVGKLAYVDFGLDQEYIEELESDFYMMTSEMMWAMLPKIVRNRHKYQAGYVVGLAGSPQYPGAALLCSLAALRGGAGIVRLLYPKGMESELASSPPELIKMAYHFDKHDDVIKLMNQASANFLGPGISLSLDTRKLLKKMIPHLLKPVVIDADGLTIVAEEKINLPANTILTPHLGEMKKLLDISEEVLLDWDFLQKCHQYAKNKSVTLVLKGGPSFVLHPNEKILVCPQGDPGMATAGSGDVLTGLIAALLAQGCSNYQAAALGVYLHALAGEYAAENLSSYCMLASDLISYLPDAFLFGEKKV